MGKLFYPLTKKYAKEVLTFLKQGTLEKKRLTLKKCADNVPHLVFSSSFLTKKASVKNYHADLVAIKFPKKASLEMARLQNYLKEARELEAYHKVFSPVSEVEFVNWYSPAEENLIEDEMEDKEARFKTDEKMKITDPRLPEEFVEMNQNPPPEVLKLREKMLQKKKARFKKDKKMKITDPRLPKEFVEMNQNPPPEVLKLRENMLQKKKAFLKKKLEKLAGGAAPSGKYGFTKKIENSSEALIRKVSRLAESVAKKAYRKDPNVLQFFSIHAKRSGSEASKILLEECKGLIPKIASSTKIAGKIGLYGLPERTVKIGLQALIEFREKVGYLTSEFHQKKLESYNSCYDYLTEHKKQSKCKVTKFILSTCLEPVSDASMVKLGSGRLFWEEV